MAESQNMMPNPADELTRLRVDLELCRQELQASNMELEQFTYGVAHDLLAPLIRASSSCHVLLEDHADQLNPEAQRWINLALDHVEHAQRRVAALRRLSSVLTDAQPFEPIDASLVLQDVIGRLAAQISERAARITTGPLDWIQADRCQFDTLLENLIVNALQYNRSEVPEIELGLVASHVVRTSPLSAATQALSGLAFDQVRLYFIRDNGVGIPPANFKRIFAPFQKVQPSGDSPGDGIGLALCQRIVKRHGGTIWAEPTLEGGSVFYFSMMAISD